MTNAWTVSLASLVSRDTVTIGTSRLITLVCIFVCLIQSWPPLRVCLIDRLAHRKMSDFFSRTVLHLNVETALCHITMSFFITDV